MKQRDSCTIEDGLLLLLPLKVFLFRRISKTQARDGALACNGGHVGPDWKTRLSIQPCYWVSQFTSLHFGYLTDKLASHVLGCGLAVSPSPGGNLIHIDPWVPFTDSDSAGLGQACLKSLQVICCSEFLHTIEMTLAKR